MQPERLGSPKLSCQSTGRTWPLCNPFRQVPGLAARGRVHSRSVDFIGTAKWNPIPTCKETRCVCVVVAKLLLPCWAVGTRSDPRAREWKQLPTPRPVEGGEMLTAGDSPTSTPQWVTRASLARPDLRARNVGEAWPSKVTGRGCGDGEPIVCLSTNKRDQTGRGLGVPAGTDGNWEEEKVQCPHVIRVPDGDHGEGGCM